MKIFNFELFREWLLNNDHYTTEDMELILRAIYEWETIDEN